MGRGRPAKGSSAGASSKAKAAKPVKKAADSDEEEEVECIEDEEVEKLDDKNKEDLIELPVSSKDVQKIIVTHKGILDIGWENIEQITIPHPKSMQRTVFLIDTRLPEQSEDLKMPFIYEVMTMEGDTRSWFVGDNVVSDGNIYACTPMDPLFFVLPSLIKTKKAVPLKDHLSESIHNLKVVDVLAARLSATKQLDNISKKIVCDDIVAYKFLEDKTLNWLTDKAIKTSQFLTEQEITGSEASISSNFTKSSNGVPEDKKKEEYMRYACEILGEYLPDELKKLLFEKLGLPFVQEKSIKRKGELDSSDSGNAKKLKVANENETIEPIEDYGSSSPFNLNSKLKTKDKELQKAAKGTQSLFKFFAPKAK